MTWWPWSAPPGPSVEEGMPGGASSAVSAGRNKKGRVSEGHSVRSKNTSTKLELSGKPHQELGCLVGFGVLIKPAKLLGLQF